MAKDKTTEVTPPTEAEMVENFKRRAGGYINNALDQIARLGQLGQSRTVKYEPAQVERAVKAIQAELDRASKALLSPKEAAKSGFEF